MCFRASTAGTATFVSSPLFSSLQVGLPFVDLPLAPNLRRQNRDLQQWLIISKGFAFEVCIRVICQKASKEVSNGFAFGVCNLDNLANEGVNLAKMSSCGRLCKPDRVSKVTREESACVWRPSFFILCQVQMPIPLKMTYFYPLHFVMGVCKWQQMPSQFAKAFGDASLPPSVL